MKAVDSLKSRTRVVIVGAGFGGLAAAKQLAKPPIDITVIDKRNYHLFQPLLYQVATADLSPADVAWPIRSIFAKYQNVRVILGKVEGIDLQAREVISERIRLPYDYLILATGSYHSYFGHDEWAMYAPGLKRIIDATEIRKRILLAFELAEVATSSEERERQMTFVVIGGGPTGVEMAGAIAELARHTLTRDFRNIDPSAARVILVEASDRLLRAFPEKLSAYAKIALEKLGVEVLLNHSVEVRGKEGAFIGDMLIPTSSMIWAAGEVFDVVVQSAPAMDDYAKLGGIKPDSRAKVARGGIGMAVGKDATPPDISTPDAFKTALANAKSIAMTDTAMPNGSGVLTQAIFEKASVVDAIKPKLKVVGLDPGQQQIAKGEIEIGFFNISEIRPFVKFGGAVPASLQQYTNYEVAVPVKAPTPNAAAGLAKVIGGAAAQVHWQSAGMEPAH